ncbi:hypothetical protein KMZ68_24805 [Bradyrhizobium sediminis]|uniref:Cysteine rich repeat-containing protein n=1 Tax=Bradyrhizobium sediminis TaxID=2840469 RepID=A0A975NQA4_9BRAD|nr:hypothetical protein [Bradyrhizobium sediminis]QWG18124.1 hypothetical protein KMZ68_24805 [Bradyrhizobium sediminis]
MINTLKHRAMMATAMFMVVTPAFSQAPTDAQRSAIRSECRADYQALCASVPPGGEASLQCLQKNMPNLSSGCAGAVRAVGPAAAPKAESAPAAAPKAESAPAAAPAKPAATTSAPAAAPAAAPKAAASTAAKQPTDAQVSAIRTACRSDYQKVCAGVPTGGSASLQCLDMNKAKTSGGCQQALNAVSGGTAAPAAGVATAAAASPGAAPAAAAPAPALRLRPMLPREELFVLRSACSGDVRGLCGGVAPGGGRIMQCLANQPATISSACKQVLVQFAAP